MPYYTHIPFAPSNYDGLDTANDASYYVKELIEGGEDFILYRNSAELDVVDKTPYLEQVAVITGVFRDIASLVNLSVTIEYNSVPDFNYVYIGVFKRYYTVTGVTSIRNNLWEISLSIDVLMTYKDVVLSTTAFVDRNEFEYNANLVDTKNVVEEEFEYTVTELPNTVFRVGGWSQDDVSFFGVLATAEKVEVSS